MTVTARAALVASGLLLFSPASLLAQPQCVFLECGPQNAPNPTPARAPSIANVTAAPLPWPSAQAERSPRSQRHVCAAAGGFDYCVTSILAPQFGNTYGPRNLIDAELSTAWVEGQSGQGEGETVLVDLKGVRRLSDLQIMNGYHKNDRLFRANSRVKQVTVRLSSGATRTQTLEDAPGVQSIVLTGLEAAWLELRIDSVYPGTRYKDTAITELRVVAER